MAFTRELLDSKKNFDSTSRKTISETPLDRRTFVRGAGGLLVAAVTGGPLLAACSSSSSVSASATAAGAPVRGGKAELALQISPVNMDPADGELYASIQVYQNIFSALIEVNDKYEFLPNLATTWQQEDPTTWKFELVDNAVWQNGLPVTSQDVAYTLTRMKTHPLGAYLSQFKSVETINDHAFRIHLSRPYGPMEATLASLVEITNEKAITSTNPQLNPIGCGPYRMTKWVQGSFVQLERWDKYFKSSKPYLDEVTFSTIEDPTVALSSLQTGQAQWIQGVPPQQSSTLQSSSTIHHTNAAAVLPYLYIMNARKPPFDNLLVRQAVSWAIDRQAIVKLAFFGTAVEATEAVSPPNPWYTGVNPYNGAPDLDKAKSLMSKAKQGNVTVTYLNTAGDTISTTMGELIKSQLAPLGITVNIVNQSGAEWFGSAVKGDYGILSTYFSASMDPALTYYLVGYSTSGFNISGYKSARLDSLLNQFTFQADQNIRKRLYPEVVSTFAEEATNVFVANQLQQYWTVPTLHGSQPYPDLSIRVEDMWLS